MELAKTDLIAALRLRYDHYSADTMFQGARERAGLVDQPTYSEKQVAAFRVALAAIGDRLGAVDQQLDHLLGSTAPTTAKAPPAAEPEVAAPAREPVATPPASDLPSMPPGTEPNKPAAAESGKATIAVTGLELDEGEVVQVCGGCPDLGDWDAEHARAMTRDGDRWITSVTLAPDAEVEFKFLCRASDGSVVWEGGPNRTLKGTSGTDDVAAVWRVGSAAKA